MVKITRWALLFWLTLRQGPWSGLTWTKVPDTGVNPPSHRSANELGRKIAVTIGILLENPRTTEGVSGRALGPGLAFLPRRARGRTGFAGDREPRYVNQWALRDATRPPCRSRSSLASAPLTLIEPAADPAVSSVSFR